MPTDLTDLDVQRRDGSRNNALHVRVVHDHLRDAILRGELGEGVPISQVKLAKTLGVSRTPLREAVRMLQREGLIVSEPNRRVCVAPLSVHDLEELYAHRLVLEVLAMRLSLSHLTEADFEAMAALLKEMADAKHGTDFESWEVPHLAFHSALRRYAGERIAHEAEVLSDHSERYRRVYLADSTARYAAHAEHQAILEACCERNERLASELLARHLARTALTVIATVAPEHDPLPVRVAVQLVIATPASDGKTVNSP